MKMKAVLMSQYGDVEVLETKEIDVPRPQAAELLVQVHACGLNPVDEKLRSGALMGAVPLIFPSILGVDVSGVVQEVGSEVSGFKVGDEVYFHSPLNQGGGNAEFCVIDQKWVAKKPRSISHIEAASLPVVGLTAVQTLRDFSNMKAGDLVLIHAGAGGVGSFAIQYAKLRGANVFSTASQKNHALLKSLGADHVIDYQKEDFVEICRRAGGMDIVLETVGGLNYSKSILSAKREGAVPCIVNPPDADVKALSEQKKIKTDFFLLSGSHFDLHEIAQWVDAGKIKPVITQVLRLEEEDIKRGHKQMKSGSTQGKWVIKVRE